jgi:hypothetical protein
MTLPLTIISRVHDGGFGAGAWGARITGQAEGTWKFKREWCGRKGRPRSGRRCRQVDIYLRRAGVYELRNVGGFQGEGEWSGFIRVAADGSYEILGKLSAQEVLALIES